MTATPPVVALVTVTSTTASPPVAAVAVVEEEASPDIEVGGFISLLAGLDQLVGRGVAPVRGAATRGHGRRRALGSPGLAGKISRIYSRTQAALEYRNANNTVVLWSFIS